MDTLPSTIEECHQVIRLLLNKLDDLSRRFEALETETKKLRLENVQLKERLNNNSSNSSLPPSKSLKKKKNPRQSSGKTSGGQPGHKGHYRELLPSDQVGSIENCPLPRNCLCGGLRSSLQLCSRFRTRLWPLSEGVQSHHQRWRTAGVAIESGKWGLEPARFRALQREQSAHPA